MRPHPYAPGRIDVRRDALLKRVRLARPRVLCIIAPAGYGKTTLARQLTEDALSVECDCAAGSGILDLARSVIASLARVIPEKVAFFAQYEVQMSAGAGDESKLALALEAWRHCSIEHTFIFENAEALLEIDGAMGFISKMLAQLPSGRTAIICSRRRPPVQLSRFVPPDRVSILTADDLRFTRDEFIAVIDPKTAARETIDKAFEVSRGWPMVASLFARLLREGKLREVLLRLDDVAFDELYDYIAQEALRQLPEDVIEALCALALLPAATMQDVAQATSDGVCEKLREYARTSPFVRITGSQAELHPVIAGALGRRYRERQHDILSRVAAGYLASGENTRAAEIFLADGDHESAAKAIDATPWLEVPQSSVGIARIVASLDRNVLMHHPQLWGVSIAFSRFSIDPVTAIGEARILLQRMGDEASFLDKVHVVRPLAGYLSRLGMHQEGYRLITEFERTVGVPQIPRSINEAGILYIRMMIAGRLGKLDESKSLAERVRPFVMRHDGMASLFLIEYAAETLRALGEWVLERKTLDEAIASSRRAEYWVNTGLALAEAAFGSFVVGDAGAFQAYCAELERCVEEYGVRGLWYFSTVAGGNLDLPPLGLELPKWIACAHIVAACSCADANSAVSHASQAHEAAERFGSPYLRVLAEITRAELIPRLRSERSKSAFDIAQGVNSPPLHAAVAAYMAGDSETGILKPFIARLRRDMRNRPKSCDVAVLSGQASVDGMPVHFSDRKGDLLAVLGQSRYGCTREAIIERLWPDHEQSSAVNAFNLCLHQTRKALGEEAIRLQRERYLFGDNVRVDIWQIEDYLAALALRSELTESQNAVLRRFYERLCEPLPQRYAGYSWFDAMDRRISELRCDVAERLAREALRLGRPDEALALARKIIEHDPCDEPAREIVIRAYVAADEEALAFREFRRYREILWKELEAAPSLSLETILMEARGRQEKVIGKSPAL